MKNQISDTWSDKQKVAKKKHAQEMKHEILIKNSLLLAMFFNSNKGKTVNGMG